MKNLTFDAISVKTEASTTHSISVDIDTWYPSEVLDNFSPDEIIEDYSELEALYEALKDHFGDNK